MKCSCGGHVRWINKGKKLRCESCKKKYVLVDGKLKQVAV